MTDARSTAGGLPHAIRRQAWEVEVGDEELALALRPRFADWNRRSWLPRIERIFDELDTPGRHLRLRRLDLDLGTFVAQRIDGTALDELERRVGERLESTLRQELRRVVAGSPEVLAAHAARVELFEHYLLRGTVPFWASRHGFRFAELFEQLIGDRAEDVVRVIRRHGHRQRVFRRLVAQLDLEAFHRLLHLLEPEHAALLVAYLLDVGRLHRARPLVPLGPRRLELDLGVLTLAYLVTERGSRFNRKSYVRSLIRGLARSQGLLYADLLRTFGRSLGSATEKEARSPWLLRSSLPDLLRELLAELDATLRPVAAATRHGSLDRLRHQLLERLSASRAVPAAASFERALGESESEPRLDEMLLALAEHDPRSVRRFLEPLRLRGGERRAVAGQSSPRAFQSLLEILAPADAEALAELVASLGRVPSPYRRRGAEIREAVLAEVLQAGAGRPLGEEAFARILQRLFESPLPPPVAGSLDRELSRAPSHLPEAPRTTLRNAVARAAGHRNDTVADAGPEKGGSDDSLARDRPRRVVVGPSQENGAVAGVNEDEDPPRPRRETPRHHGGGVEWGEEERSRGDAGRPGSPGLPRPGEAGRPEEPPAGDTGALYLDNAGLVLFAPFLPRLLAGLEVLDDGRIRHVESASRAVHLLQYLVDGRLDAAEPELVLPKVLCGWPVEEPVAARIEPDDEHRALCDGLLGSVLSHWPALASSSLEALQETFLQREGRLEMQEGEHRLRVERKTFDVLMEDLPWSLSVILHDAMEHPLYVTW